MTEEISTEFLSKAADNIQKLFDLTIRIDEHIKSIQSKQSELDNKITEITKTYVDVQKKIAVILSKDYDREIKEQVLSINSKLLSIEKEVGSQVINMDKRLILAESSADSTKNKWEKISTFVIQLFWILIASYLLMKFNLQPPAVP